MKKMMTIAMMALLMGSVALVGCGGNAAKSDSPSAVVQKALSCAVQKDYKGMVKYFESSAAATEAELDEAAAVLELLYSLSGGISEFEILGEEIEENGMEAEVKVKLTDLKGESRTDEADVVKTDQGWRLRMD